MYNLNRYNYEENNTNNLYFINKYPDIKRTASPQIINNKRRNNYYFNEANQKKRILKNRNEDILNPQYQYNTNPINFIQQQNQKYSDYISYNNDSNNYYPIQNLNYHEQIKSQNHNYLYTDHNIIPNVIPHNYQNNKIIYNDNINENNGDQNKYKNGVKLNITNYETQYPMTFLNANPHKKRNIFIQNNNTNNLSHIMNIKEQENNFQSKTMKKSNNRANFNLSKIKPMNDLSGEMENISMKKSKNKFNNKENNIINKKKNNEFFNKSSNNFHKKNKSLNEFHNILNEKHYAEDLRYENNNRNINNNYYNNNIFKNIKKRINHDDELNLYKYENNNYNNYNMALRHNIKSKNYIGRRDRLPLQDYGKTVNEYEEQEKYILKIKKFISHLEHYYIISFHNFFYYFLEQLFLYNQEKINNNKNSLLKRFQRTKNNTYSNFISNNFSPQYKNYINNINKEKYKQLNINSSYLNKFRNIYIPKKNLEPMEINKKNNSINFGHHKNRSLEYIPYLTNQNYNNLSFTDNRINLNIDFNSQKNYKKNKKKDNSVDKFYSKNNRYSNNNMDKSHDNLVQNRLSPNSSTFHKNINGIMNKKAIIYIKPKAGKLNLKRIIMNKENELNNINENSSFRYSNTINNINSNYIYNNIFNKKKKTNENIIYNVKNNSFSMKKVKDVRSPFKLKFKDHIRNISDLAQEIMDNVNLNDNKVNNELNENANRLYYDNSDSENGINEIIGNEDLIEETIIKDICTYDKKLWVFIKYIISPKTKQNFLKIKRLRYIKSSKDKFLIKELNSLKATHTDSIEIISRLPYLHSNKKYNISAMKEISEEKESIDSNIQEENLNIKLSNMINILEEYKKQNFLFFYKFFFNLLNFQNNNKINTLAQKKVFKNILENFQDYNKNIKNNENNCIIDKNKINNFKTKEYWKRNLFPEISKENSYNDNENDLSLNINIARKKLFDLNKNKKQSKRSNSTEPSIINHNKFERKKNIELKRKIKLKSIIMNEFKKHYFIIWKKKNGKEIKNNKKKEEENNYNIEKKILFLKNNLIKYILKKNKSCHKEEKKEKEEEVEEEVEEEEYEEEEDSLDK